MYSFLELTFSETKSIGVISTKPKYKNKLSIRSLALQIDRLKKGK
jgi:hypothetical protein